MRTSALFTVALLVLASGSAGAEKRCPAVELRYDEFENLSEKHVDSNKDCQHDQAVYYADGRAKRAEIDSDFDGRIDTWTFFEADGKTIGRQEVDATGDGKKDRWIQYRGGRPATQLEDKNSDGKPDATLYYKDGQPKRLEEDTSFDGKTDRWVDYAAGEPVVIEDDTHHDGKPDVRAEFAPDGAKLVERQDTTRDGKYDVALFYEKRKKVRLE